MLAWIVLSIAALSGFLALFERHSEWLQSAPGLPAAIAVMGGLSLLYLLTLRKTFDTQPARFSRFAPALAFLAAAAATIPALKSAPLWQLIWPAEPGMTGAAVYQSTASRAAVRIRRSTDGRFSAQGDVNGAPMRFVIDTGAASVMLKSSDAEAAGVNLSNLAFDTAIATANGAAYVAPVRLRAVSIGAIRLDDVEGFVARPASLNENLLGQSFLKRLPSYEVGGEFLTLRQ